MNVKKFRKASLLGLLLLASASTFAQHEGWHLKDKVQDGYWGISLDKAYDFLKSTNRKPQTVIVGVVDSGIDTAHVDLKNVLWVNPKEAGVNGRDDDKNGYIDDKYGWNFLGSRDGKSFVEKDSYAVARFYWQYKDKFEKADANKISKKDKAIYTDWLRARTDIQKYAKSDSELKSALIMQENFTAADEIIRKKLGKEEYSCKDLTDFSSDDKRVTNFVGILMNYCKRNNNNDITNKNVLGALSSDVEKMQFSVKPPKDYRGIVVGDNYYNFKDRFYGNTDVLVNNESGVHGTHVAGIIGAERSNGKGMDGVADHVKLLAVRAVPDGDEHDKDIALGIRYAVDNGAKVINMSFGKGYSPEKKWVDEAVKYAERKGVLLVHAAGNDAKNVDIQVNYPNPTFLNGKTAKNWITVGASGDEKTGGLVARFSNYGKQQVDVFAPGVQIYSTVPGVDTYQNLQGTSMAAPVVSGIAALLMSYYPELDAKQVKSIIEKSVVVPTEQVKTPGSGTLVQLADLSRTGGIVNAYEAVKLADSIVSKKNK